MTLPALETQELTKVFQSPIRQHALTALDRVTLQVQRGEVFGLLGPNGAGKTTFVKILLGITHPTQGRVSILGADLPAVDVKERIGYLPENPRYPEYLTGEKALEILARLSGVRGPEGRSRIAAWLKRVKMYEWRTMRLKRYSKGMLQRIGLAQALINDPDLVFLDEPTDGVDPVGRFEIRNILLEQKAQGKTIFINSHLLSEVERLCDRVAILNRGRLVHVGTMADLTRAAEQYTIEWRAALSAAQVADALSPFPGVRVEDHQLLFAVPDVGELNRIIDHLRAARIDIVSVTPARRTLEETFMDLIQIEK